MDEGEGNGKKFIPKDLESQVTEEGGLDSEIITPQSVQARVMQFFDGADLNKEGETQTELCTVRTRTVPHEINPFRYSTALVNGHEVAEYSKTFQNTKPAPGEVVNLESFELKGVDEPWRVELRYTRYDGQEDELVLVRLGGKESGGNPQYNGEQIRNVPADLLQSTAKMFGLKV